MNRRTFLKWLGVGTAIAAVAPSTLLPEAPACVAEPAAGYATYVMGQNAMIGEYCNYVNFSDFAISAAIDEVVSNAAEELGNASARRINYLYETVAFGRA